MVLQGDDEDGLAGVTQEELAIEGFDEAGVYYADIEPVLGGERLSEDEGVGDHGADGPDDDVGAGMHDFGAPEREEAAGGLGGLAGAGAARIANEGGAVVGERGGHHVGEVVFIGRSHDERVRHGAKVSDIEKAVVGGAVVGGEAGAVHAEYDGQALEGDVVDDGIVGALKKGGVDGDDGFEALGGEAGGEERGVFLGDADVKKLGRQGGGEVVQAGAAGHRGGDADDAFIGGGESDELLAENILIVGRGAGAAALGFAGGRIEGAETVEFFGMGAGGVETAALFGDDVKKDGGVGVARELEVFDQLIEVMAVNGADVAQTEFLEKR